MTIENAIEWMRLRLIGFLRWLPVIWAERALTWCLVPLPGALGVSGFILTLAVAWRELGAMCCTFLATFFVAYTFLVVGISVSVWIDAQVRPDVLRRQRRLFNA